MIRELKQKGWTISAIARETGFDRKTIRKYLDAETAPQSKKEFKEEVSWIHISRIYWNELKKARRIVQS